MISSFDMSRFIAIFLEESQETLQKVESLLLKAEETKTMNEEDIHNLFRYIHTLKGNSSSIGYSYLSKLAHGLEDFMDKIRHGELIYSLQIGELLLHGYDLLNEVMQRESMKTMDQDSFDHLCLAYLKELETYRKESETYGNHVVAETSVVLTQASLPIVEGVAFGFFEENLPKEKDSSSEEMTLVVSEVNASPSATIRIHLDKIDNLMNNIGELVIAMSMLDQYAQNVVDPKIKSGFAERISFLQHTIRELQESVMSTRMVPMEQVYLKFPKTVRDIAKKLGKEIKFITKGDEVEIDKVMIEGLNDPLMHIIRNACDHGIESAQERSAAGKSSYGTIFIEAMQAKGQIMISISDDGRGIDSKRVIEKAIIQGILDKEKAADLNDQQKLELIFHPGLTTTTDITDISGRGVGMDVVHSNINRIGGSILIESTQGKGTKFTLLLPLTLAIVDVLNVVVGGYRFVLPLSLIIESLQPTLSMIQSVAQQSSELLMLRKEAISIIRLHEIFNIEEAITELDKGMLIIVRYGTSKVALFMDMFLHQQQVVIKPIDKNFRTVEGFSGATIKGDGSIGLILDVPSMVAMNQRIKE